MHASTIAIRIAQTQSDLCLLQKEVRKMGDMISMAANGSTEQDRFREIQFNLLCEYRNTRDELQRLMDMPL